MDGDIRTNSYDDGSSDILVGEQKIRNFNINFGPQHPAAHGVLRMVLTRGRESEFAEVPDSVTSGELAAAVPVPTGAACDPSSNRPS